MIEQEFLLSKFISPGAKIELEALDRVILSDGSEQRKVYESKVVDVIDEDRLEILMPMEQTKLVLLPVKGEYHLHFFTGKGLFQCDAKVASRYKNGSLYLLEMELISDLQKYQRREYYRYTCTLDMKVRDLTEPEKKNLTEGRGYMPEENVKSDKATIVDISGGGLRFVTNVPFEVKGLIACEYVLMRQDRPKTMELVGEVLSCRQLETNRGQYEHRVRFVHIQHHQREDIIRYIFEEERKKRQRDI